MFVRQLSYLQLMCLDQDVKSVADRHDILSVSVAVAVVARRDSKKHPCNYRQPGDGDARCCCFAATVPWQVRDLQAAFIEHIR